mmetsp:Transcript_4540/g.8115  ORF Transcript_4540/g.8115 Transcript_4540/m.8115 type:complete len:223 (-) Transcript_4540:1336-2004(-)
MVIKLPEQRSDHSGYGGGSVAVIVKVRSIRRPEGQGIRKEHDEENDQEFHQIVKTVCQRLQEHSQALDSPKVLEGLDEAEQHVEGVPVGHEAHVPSQGIQVDEGILCHGGGEVQTGRVNPNDETKAEDHNEDDQIDQVQEIPQILEIPPPARVFHRQILVALGAELDFEYVKGVLAVGADDQGGQPQPFDLGHGALHAAAEALSEIRSDSEDVLVHVCNHSQ